MSEGTNIEKEGQRPFEYKTRFEKLVRSVLRACMNGQIKDWGLVLYEPDPGSHINSTYVISFLDNDGERYRIAVPFYMARKGRNQRIRNFLDTAEVRYGHANYEAIGSLE